jgi:hypothetical protein
MAATATGVLARLVAVHQSLDKAGLDHAVGGALALAHYVYPPRGTADIDLNLTADPSDPGRVLSALPKAIEIHPGAADQLRTDSQVRLWWRSAKLDTPVDLFLPASPVYHRLVVERARPAVFFGAEIKVLTATDLMVFKMLFDRRKDWADIESLIRAGAGDPEEAADWVAQIVGSVDSRLAKLQEIRDEVDASSRPCQGGGW